MKIIFTTDDVTTVSNGITVKKSAEHNDIVYTAELELNEDIMGGDEVSLKMTMSRDGKDTNLGPFNVTYVEDGQDFPLELVSVKASLMTLSFVGGVKIKFT